MLEVACSKGTYIRSLAEDIGHALGTCGTVTALRRLAAGQFSLAEAKTLEELAAMDMPTLLATLIAVDKPLAGLPSVQLSEAQAISIRYGQTIAYPASIEGSVRLYEGPLFLGLGEMLLDGKIAPKKLFNING
jgi:tRNA pseudouridine55 synthase